MRESIKTGHKEIFIRLRTVKLANERDQLRAFVLAVLNTQIISEIRRITESHS